MRMRSKKGVSQGVITSSRVVTDWESRASRIECFFEFNLQIIMIVVGLCGLAVWWVDVGELFKWVGIGLSVLALPFGVYLQLQWGGWGLKLFPLWLWVGICKFYQVWIQVRLVWLFYYLLIFCLTWLAAGLGVAVFVMYLG